MRFTSVMRRVFLLALLALGAPVMAFGQNSDQQKGSLCDRLEGPNDVLMCALQKSPEVEVSAAARVQAERSVDAAKQIPNPELDVESVRVDGGDWSHEVILKQPLELGGKRPARKEVARSGIERAKAELSRAQERVAIETVGSLYRLRQIDVEIHVIDEIVETLGEVQKPYGRLLKLGPEQEISLSTLRLSAQQHRLQKSALENERVDLTSKLRVLLGREIAISEKLLPKFRSDWPVAREESKGVGGAELALAQADLKIAQAQKKQAQSEAWPDIAIGPKLEHKTGATKETGVGIALSLPLPIFNANGGGIAEAEAGVARAERELRYKQDSLLQQKLRYLESYKRAATSLKDAANRTNLEVKHDRMHKLLGQGLLPAPMVLELHRQILEYQQTLHMQELMAVQSFWGLKALDGQLDGQFDGRLLKETLQ